MQARKLRLLKIAKRHLDEAMGWNEAGKSFRDSLYALRYANRMANAHLEMAKYWEMAVKNLHYIPGTWATTF